MCVEVFFFFAKRFYYIKPAMPSRKSKKKKKSGRRKQVPFVSICTPTFNRRPFFEMCIRCLEAQTYPHSRMEWIVYDDGTDSVKDIVDEFASRTSIHVRYFRSETYTPLSKKRNFLNEKADGAFLCYWDDDDYYQPTRIEASVKLLQTHPECLIAGGSSMYCYFNDTGEVWKFGPYSPNHTTAAVMFFRKELLEQTQFEEDAFLSEEKAFLKDYTIPMVQMPPHQTIVVVAHSQNSFDKRNLIEKGDTQFVHKTKLTLEQVIPDYETRQFITNDLEPALAQYKDGDVRKKPDILLAMIQNQKKRMALLNAEYLKIANAYNTLVGRIQANARPKPPQVPRPATQLEPPPPQTSKTPMRGPH